MNRFEKAAIQVIKPFDTHVKQKDFPSLATGKGSIVNLNDAKLLSKAMEAGAYHDALNNTRVELFGSKLNDMSKRVKDNPRNSWITKARFHNPYESDINTVTQHLPDAYALEPDNVWLPSGNAGVLMHELGHAIDFNEYPKDSIIRHGIASAYSKFAPTLWKEHAAWSKGRDRLLSGAARTKLDPSVLVKTLEQAARTKPMGLGSYWGSGLGTIGGLGLGGLAAAAIAAGTHKFPIALPILGAGLGGTIGALAGTSLGKAYGNKKSLGDEAAVKSYMNEYANAYSKEHGISKEEALGKIEALREAIKAKVKKQKLKEKSMGRLNKAAEFGAMMGKMAAGPGILDKVPRMFDEAPRVFDAKYNNGPGTNGIQHVANSPAQSAQLHRNYGEAATQLEGGMDPAGFVRPPGLNPYDLTNSVARAKYPKDEYKNTPASSWRSAPVSQKVREVQNEKHYNEMTNMNRANPPKDINGIPAARSRINDDYNSAGSKVLPFLLGNKRFLNPLD
jgi:hypothetical protein